MKQELVDGDQRISRVEVGECQFRQWADRPVRRVVIDEWNNRTFRLGLDMSVRLPTVTGFRRD